MFRNLTITAIATIGLLMTACDSAVLTGPDSGSTDSGATDGATTADTGNDPVDLISTAEAAGNFTRLLQALESTNLRAVLADPNNINTIFAPTDNAFDALGEEGLSNLLDDTAPLTDTLLYHVLAGRNDASALTAQAGTPITMLNDKQAAITFESDQLKINTANVINSDIVASNGIIHVIDSILTPPAETVDPTNAENAPTESVAGLIANDPQFSTLLDLITATGLDSTLSEDGSFTVFAPTNEAFSAIDDDLLNAIRVDSDQLRDVLLNHVVEGNAIDSVAATAAAGTSLTSATGGSLAVTLDGDSLKINNATVTAADLAATNGVVHAIDAVLLPQAAPKPDSIVGVLAANPDYSSLVALVTQAGLVDTLNSVDGNFTLFAPNNAAIAVAQTQLAAGFTSDTAALGNLLLGHVTGVQLTSAEVIALDGSSIDMVFGSQPIVLTRDVLSIGGAIIVDPDIQADNGIIHGISSVLLP